VFDLDGTVVDAFEDIRASVNHALGLCGLPGHDIETIRGYVGNGLVRLCERALPVGRGDLLDRVVAETRAYYAAHPADLATVYPGIAEAIGALRRRGYRTALLSNKPDNLVRGIAERLELGRLFDLVVGEKPGVALKPDPAALLNLMRESGCGRCVMIGDGMPDAEVARAAGVGFVGVVWGQSSADDLARFGRVALRADDLPVLVDEALA